jgi:hypothetical protein
MPGTVKRFPLRQVSVYSLAAATEVRPTYCPLSVILPVVLYGCETWSLTLREDYIYMRERERERER